MLCRGASAARARRGPGPRAALAPAPARGPPRRARCPAPWRWRASMPPPDAAARSHDAVASFMIAHPSPRHAPGPAPTPPPRSAWSASRAQQWLHDLAIPLASTHARPACAASAPSRTSASRRLRQMLRQPVPRPAQTADHAAPSAGPGLGQRFTRLAPARTPPAPAPPLATARSRRSLPGPSASARRVNASTACWLPAGNRVSCRANAGPSRPRRRSSFTSALNFSNSASRRHTQLLCWPRRWRRLHLRQPVVTHQRLHDPRFLQLPRRPLASIQAQDRRLRRPLVHLQHTHAQRRQPGHLLRRRQTLEAIEQFQLPSRARTPPPAPTDPSAAANPPWPPPPAGSARR